MNQDEQSQERTARAIAASLDEPERHLDFESELSPYVDGTLDAAGREILESHVEDCAMCREELADLQAFAKLAPRAIAFRPALAIAASAMLIIAALLVLRREERAVVDDQRRRTTTLRPAPPVETRARVHSYARPEWAQLVARTLDTGRLPPSPALAALRVPRGDTLRGSTSVAEAALSPSGVVVESARPLFTWTASAGASYGVSVFAADEEIATSERLHVARWQPDRDLPRGRTYSWQVEVFGDGAPVVLPAPPAPPALFHILGAREREELEQARRAHPDDALLLAALYARSGLIAAADAELRKLSTSGDARVQRLLRGRQEAAEPTRTNAAQ